MKSIHVISFFLCTIPCTLSFNVIRPSFSVLPSASTSTSISITQLYSTQNENMIILVGPPGSGKSYLSKALEATNPDKYIRINQDELKTRKKCERICREALSVPDKVPIIDRCHFDSEQRAHFLKLAKGADRQVDCVVFEYPKSKLIERCMNRVGHETVTPANAKRVVGMMYGRMSPPTYDEDGIEKITFVRSIQESDEVLSNILQGKDISARSKLPRNTTDVQASSSSTSTSTSTRINTTRSNRQSVVVKKRKILDYAKLRPNDSFKIYCDLDGVLADFDAGVRNIFYGKDADSIPSFKLWSGINKSDKFYENLPMTIDGRDLWDVISSNSNCVPDILTGVPRTRRFREEKFNWCTKELATNNNNNSNIIQYNHLDMAGKKSSHSIEKGTRREGHVNVITCWSKNKHYESRPGA